ncbi:MAG: YafY family protein [Pseudomonadota bacterium]
MRRADRLFRLVQILRGGRLTTAARLAEAMEVSVRTVYRDIADLQASGVPIEGEAGVGYVMRSGFDLPPLMFTAEEVVALVVGARMASAWGGLRMAGAAKDALSKIESVLPDAGEARAALARIYAPNYALGAAERVLLDHLDDAIAARETTLLAYETEAGAASRRTVRPLGLWFWGRTWTLVAWCELRADFRMFRIDRIRSAAATGETFPVEPGQSLADLHAKVEAEEGCRFPADPLA